MASESDEEQEMEAYMDYLINLMPTKREKLMDLKHRLVEEDMTLKKIHEIKKEGLRDQFNASVGLAMDVYKYIKAFQRTKGIPG